MTPTMVIADHIFVLRDRPLRILLDFGHSLLAFLSALCCMVLPPRLPHYADGGFIMSGSSFSMHGANVLSGKALSYGLFADVDPGYSASNHTNDLVVDSPHLFGELVGADKLIPLPA